MFVNSLCDRRIGYSDTVYSCSLCAVIKLMVLGISWSVSCDGSTRTLGSVHCLTVTSDTQSKYRSCALCCWDDFFSWIMYLSRILSRCVPMLLFLFMFHFVRVYLNALSAICWIGKTLCRHATYTCFCVHRENVVSVAIFCQSVDQLYIHRPIFIWRCTN